MDFPDPNGDVPDGWALERWEAYQLLKTDESQTYASVAEAVGRKPSTISRWIRDWRNTYGPGIYVSPRAGKLNVTPEQAKEGAAAGGAVVSLKWSETRLEFATKLGATADRANDVALAGLELLLQDQDRLAALTPKDLLDLGRLAELLAKRADAQTVAPAAGGPIDEGDTSGGYGVNLSALESSMSSEATRTTFEAASIVYRQFRVDTGREVVDVDEVKQ